MIWFCHLGRVISLSYSFSFLQQTLFCADTILFSVTNLSHLYSSQWMTTPTLLYIIFYILAVIAYDVAYFLTFFCHKNSIYCFSGFIYPCIDDVYPDVFILDCNKWFNTIIIIIIIHNFINSNNNLAFLLFVCLFVFTSYSY